MIGTLLTGVPMIISVLIPSLIPAYAIWLLHDVIGASIRAPALQTLTQSYSRDESRGKDTNMTSAFRNIGMIIGPVIGGYLADININFPFLIGGIIIVLGTLILIPLNRTVDS